MIVFRVIGWLFLLGALAAFGYDVWRWWTDGGDDARFALTSIAEIWVAVDANSLVGFGSLFQNQWFPDNPDLYTNWVVPVLGSPAALPLVVIGLPLVMAFRRRRRPEADDGP